MRVPNFPPDERPAFTSLVDIAFLILIFFMALPLKRLDGKLALHLPATHGIRETVVEPPQPVRVSVRMEQGSPAFHLGQHRAARAWDLAPLLRKLGPSHPYEIDATREVAYENVVSVVDVMKGLEFPRIQFTGCRGGPGGRGPGGKR